MQPHCTSSSVSRRDFLKILLGLTGVAASLTTVLKVSDAAQSRRLFRWKEPVWIWDLSASPTSPIAIQGPIPTPDRILPFGMPGSVMKLITATALLEDGLLSANTIFICNGRVKTNGHWVVCPHPHGRLTVHQAIGFSCNVFFAQAVKGLSRHRLIYYARQFQLDRPVQSMGSHADRIELHDKLKEKIRKNNSQDKVLHHWGESFTFTTDGLDAQPFHFLALGLSPLIQPNALQLLRVAKHIAQQSIPQIRPQTWIILQQGMRLAARAGTAQVLDPADRFKLAAKTGTVPHGQNFSSWLIGYFPFEQPRYAICAYAPSGTARDSAVPLLRDFLAQWER